MEARRSRDAQREFDERQKRLQSNYAARAQLGSIILLEPFVFLCLFCLFYLTFCIPFFLAEKQIEERESERQKAYEEFLAQKEEVDKVVQQMHAVRPVASLSSYFFLLIIHAIYAESLHTRSVPCPQQDEKQKAERARKQAETQAFIKNYLEDRKRWKEEQKRKQAEEMQIIDDWNRKIEARLDALKSQKAKVRAVLLCSFFLRSPDPCQPFRYQSVFVPFSPYLVHFLSQAASGHDALLAKISAEIEANRKQRYPNLFNCTVSPLPSQNNALTWLILFASSNSSGKRLSNCCWICFWKRKRPKRKKSKTCVRRNVMP